MISLESSWMVSLSMLYLFQKSEHSLIRIISNKKNHSKKIYSFSGSCSKKRIHNRILFDLYDKLFFDHGFYEKKPSLYIDLSSNRKSIFSLKILECEECRRSHSTCRFSLEVSTSEEDLLELLDMLSFFSANWISEPYDF